MSTGPLPGTHLLCSSSLPMTTHGGKPSPIEKLPGELRDRVCELMASALHSALHRGSLPEDDPWTFTWTTPHRPPDCQVIQKRLRALSLVSKAWSRSAQRALFTVIPISSARCLMKLLRSLLLYPKNRRFIRCLIPIFSFECDKLYVGRYQHPFNLGMLTLAQLVDNFGHILFTPTVDELPHAMLLRISLIKHALHPLLPDPSNNADAHYSVYRFREVLNSALWSVVHLSPLLSAVHLRTETYYSASPFGYGEEMTYSGRFLEGGRPLLGTLSLHSDAFPTTNNRRDYEELAYESWMSCIPSIQYITLLGDSNWMHNGECSEALKLDDVYRWLDSVTKLTSLRLLKGFDDVLDV